MNGDPARRSLLASLAWRGVSTFALAAAGISGSELAFQFWALSAAARWALAGILLCDLAAYATVRVARRRDARPAGPRRYTTMHPADEGVVYTQTSCDDWIGDTIPVRGLGPDEIPGLIVAAAVAEDGRSVELTVEVPAALRR